MLSWLIFVSVKNELVQNKLTLHNIYIYIVHIKKKRYRHSHFISLYFLFLRMAGSLRLRKQNKNLKFFLYYILSFCSNAPQQQIYLFQDQKREDWWKTQRTAHRGYSLLPVKCFRKWFLLILNIHIIFLSPLAQQFLFPSFLWKNLLFYFCTWFSLFLIKKTNLNIYENRYFAI